LKKRGIQVVLCEANTRVLMKLRNAGLVGSTHCRYEQQLADALRGRDT
jgi:hypothetical protein